jgi:dTDP-4-dehydrorhamnose 3,5-epimerase
MKFTATPLTGAYLVELECHPDERGFFARTWCRREFAEVGLATSLVQCSLSHNRYRGTLRGMHYQIPTFAEDKLVRVTRGAIYDVVVDLRPGSATFLYWYGIELTADNRLALYVPQGFAHGFQTLADETEVFYQMSEYYSPEHARGFRWNDPLIGVAWPEATTTISSRDQAFASLRPDDLAVFAALRAGGAA